MKSLTLVIVTARQEPKLEWLLDSLRRQSNAGINGIPIIIVDTYRGDGRNLSSPQIRHVKPKPTIWQGAHRITQEDWWAKSNALNTGICLCSTKWIAFIDDRGVLLPGWLKCIEEAMFGCYAVCGRYAKHLHLKVDNGRIVDEGECVGGDTRPDGRHPIPTVHWYGGHCALPLEWCLQVNGFSEDICDGLGMEDVMFGRTLANNNLPMRYDPRMKIIEDRTPGEIGGGLRREDKGESPFDKSHQIVERLGRSLTSLNSFDLRQVRNRVLAGDPFPPPSASPLDWYDGQPIKEMI